MRPSVGAKSQWSLNVRSTLSASLNGMGPAGDAFRPHIERENWVTDEVRRPVGHRFVNPGQHDPKLLQHRIAGQYAFTMDSTNAMVVKPSRPP